MFSTKSRVSKSFLDSSETKLSRLEEIFYMHAKGVWEILKGGEKANMEPTQKEVESRRI
jgi:hypothetical protein